MYRSGQGMGIRLDGIAFTGAEITPDYDSLLGTNYFTLYVGKIAVIYIMIYFIVFMSILMEIL